MSDKDASPKPVHSLAHGEVRVWTVHDLAIHIRAVSKEGDPVELNGAEARGLAEILVRLADQIGE
jgi:hypothetical protein